MTTETTQLEKAADPPEAPHMNKSEREKSDRLMDQLLATEWRLAMAKTLADWIQASPDERVRTALQLWWAENKPQNPHDTDLIRWLKEAAGTPKRRGERLGLRVDQRLFQPIPESPRSTVARRARERGDSEGEDWKQ